MERENRENGERTDKMERENGERERENRENGERERTERMERDNRAGEQREWRERERTQIVFFLTVHCTCSNLKNLHGNFFKSYARFKDIF